MFNVSAFTINLSDVVLTKQEISVLDKGLKFIPTIGRFPYSFILDCKLRNIRNLKLHDYFQNDSSIYDPSAFQHLFINKSHWTPSSSLISNSTLHTVLNFSNYTNSLLSSRLIRLPNRRGPFVKCHSKIFKKNLSRIEFQSISNLRNNKHIIIKPADKGGSIVVMNRELYKQEALRQLHNVHYYKEITSSLCNITVPRISQIVFKLFQQGFISQAQQIYLTPTFPTCNRCFYLLPKVHKDRSKWPHPRMPEGRPIVSDCSSETYNICKFIDYFLKPLAIQHPSYIQDSYHFVSKIKEVIIPANAFIVTADVTALYTNMDLDRSIQVVQNSFNLHPDPSRPDDLILELLNIVLCNNYFEFDHKLYLQTRGIAMGKSFAPNLANLYLLDFDHKAMFDFHIKPMLYSRFIDDIFFIWPGSLDQLMEYDKFLNCLIPGIKLTLIPRQQIAEFLDVQVYKFHSNSECFLRTNVFFKHTDTHQLLHRSSFHPRHTTEGVLKSQFIRFKRLCSTKFQYDQACRVLYSVLKNRGYARSLFRRLKRLIWSSDFKLHITKRSSGLPIWPIINYYDPIGIKLMCFMSKAISKLGFSSHFRLVQAFKTHRNLGHMLIRSRFS